MAGTHPLRGRRAVRAGRRRPITGTRPNEPAADRRARRRRPVRAADSARAGLDRAHAGRLLRQLWRSSGWPARLALAGTAPFDVASSYTLSVVPLFILMGEVASESGCRRPVQAPPASCCPASAAGSRWRRLRPRACFGAVSGSSLADRRHHDADGAAGAAQGRLRRRPRDRLHRRRRLDSASSFRRRSSSSSTPPSPSSRCPSCSRPG